MLCTLNKHPQPLGTPAQREARIGGVRLQGLEDQNRRIL